VNSKPLKRIISWFQESRHVWHMIFVRTRSPLLELVCIAGLIAVATLAPLAVLASALT
jgi:hypothetical protein